MGYNIDIDNRFKGNERRLTDLETALEIVARGINAINLNECPSSWKELCKIFNIPYVYSPNPIRNLPVEGFIPLSELPKDFQKHKIDLTDAPLEFTSNADLSLVQKLQQQTADYKNKIHVLQCELDQQKNDLKVCSISRDHHVGAWTSVMNQLTKLKQVNEQLNKDLIELSGKRDWFKAHCNVVQARADRAEQETKKIAEEKATLQKNSEYEQSKIIELGKAIQDRDAIITAFRQSGSAINTLTPFETTICQEANRELVKKNKELCETIADFHREFAAFRKQFDELKAEKAKSEELVKSLGDSYAKDLNEANARSIERATKILRLSALVDEYKEQVMIFDTQIGDAKVDKVLLKMKITELQENLTNARVHGDRFKKERDDLTRELAEQRDSVAMITIDRDAWIKKFNNLFSK